MIMLTVNELRTTKVTFYAREKVWFYNSKNEYISMEEGEKKSMSLAFFHGLSVGVKMRLCIKSKKAENIMKEYFKCVKLMEKNGEPIKAR